MNLNAATFGQVIAFVPFVLFCMKYVWPPLMVVIGERQKETADSFASTEQAHKDLDLAKANATDQLKKAKTEARVIIEQANERCSQVLDEAKAKAEQERVRIVAQAQVKTGAERKHAYEELCRQVVILAAAGTERIIERSVDEAANSDIVNKLVTEL